MSFGVSLTVIGRLMVVIVRVGLVVRVDMLFLQWRRRRPCSLFHPRRQEGTRHPGGDTERMGETYIQKLSIRYSFLFETIAIISQ